jgi:hypothetical protein
VADDENCQRITVHVDAQADDVELPTLRRLLIAPLVAGIVVMALPLAAHAGTRNVECAEAGTTGSVQMTWVLGPLVGLRHLDIVDTCTTAWMYTGFATRAFGRVGFALAPGSVRSLGRLGLERHGWFKRVPTYYFVGGNSAAHNGCAYEVTAQWRIGVNGMIHPLHCP